MNKRGDTNSMMNTIIYLVIFILFFIGMFWFISSYSNRSGFFEDFYAKEIAEVINSAEQGMSFKVDITPLAIVSSKNGKPLKDIITIDNVNNRVIASSKLNTGVSFGFFNDVDVVDWRVEGPSGGAENTRFIFKIVEKQRDEL